MGLINGGGVANAANPVSAANGSGIMGLLNSSAGEGGSMANYVKSVQVTNGQQQNASRSYSPGPHNNTTATNEKSIDSTRPPTAASQQHTNSFSRSGKNLKIVKFTAGSLGGSTVAGSPS